MSHKKNILAINGSASRNSANQHLLQHLATIGQEHWNLNCYYGLKSLPHFDPDVSVHYPPAAVIELRHAIDSADGIIICTPEYIFSIPSGLKNALEWCIATTVFSDKVCGLITASASGAKGHEQLQLLMKTAMARFNDDTCLLISGIKGKINKEGQLQDAATEQKISFFIDVFTNLLYQ